MSDTPQRRRLLVALDAAEDAQALLDTAADMAARMRADLVGLFIEDADLIGLGDNPLIRMVSAHATATRSIAAGEIERALRRQVAAARTALEHAAKTRRLQASFEVQRGRLATALQGIEQADLILVRRGAGNVQHTPGTARARVSAATRQVVSAVRRSVIVLNMRRGAPRRGFGRLFVLFDGSPETERALLAAAEIADRRGGDRITVLPVATSETDAKRIEQAARTLLTRTGLDGDIAPAVAPDLAGICRATRESGPGLLVLHAAHALLADNGMAHVLDELDCSVMVVR
jgi:nucleotide-binding universal stress UspA family protein